MKQKQQKRVLNDAEYSRNLLCAVLGVEELPPNNNMIHDLYAPLAERYLDHVYSKSKVNFAKIIEYRFRYCMLYREIGSKFGKSVERIREIILQALRSLRSQRALMYTQNPFENINRIYELSEQIRVLEKNLNADKINISELELSLRVYNSLHRARIETVADLEKLSRTDLQNIRGMGNNSINELINQLKIYYPNKYFKLYNEE